MQSARRHIVRYTVRTPDMRDPVLRRLWLGNALDWSTYEGDSDSVIVLTSARSTPAEHCSASTVGSPSGAPTTADAPTVG